MNERPILFSAPMIRALLAGTKTQTRRAVKITNRTPGLAACLQPADPAWVRQKTAAELCPYGQPGDRLWVREAFSGPHCMDASDGCKAVPPSKWGDCSRIWYWADGNPTEGDWTRPRPSIHMPRWASRILLEITAVRVERLQDISEADAKAEGCCSRTYRDGRGHEPATLDYERLWESINGAGLWAANPWVWVVVFRRVEQ